MMKRILALLLTALMLAQLAACNGATNDPAKDTAPGDTTPADTEPAETEPAVTYAPNQIADIPEGLNYEGYSIGIINQNSGGQTEQGPNGSSMLGTNEEDATVLSLEAYYRDLYLKDTFNITFHETSFYYEDLATSTEQLLMSGDLSWGLANWNGFRTFTASLKGLFYDLNELPNIDMTKAYWANSVAENFTMLDKLFLAVTDYTTGTYSAHKGIIFNKKMITDNALTSPYDLVDANNWTFDEFGKLLTAVTRDMNDDGQFTAEDDIVGLLHDQRYGFMDFSTAAGIMHVTRNEAGIPVYTALQNEKLTNVWDWAQTMLLNANDAQSESLTSFKNDQALMTILSFGGITLLRDMESDFGLVPFPKYDTTQDRYYSPSENPGILAVLFTTEVPELIGYVLEAGAAYGHQKLIPLFYDNDLKLKLARDPKMGEMVDLIRTTTVYQMTINGFLYETHNFWENAYEDGSAFGTSAKRYEKKMNRDMERMVKEMLEAIEDRD